MSSAIFYFLACKEIDAIVRPLGFSRYKRFFYRITETGVVQQFCLLWRNRSFTIRFSLSSVYSDNDRTQEGSEIYQIIDGSNTWIGENFDKSSIGDLTHYTYKHYSYKQAVEMCKQALSEYLLPYFEATSDIKTAHQYMRKHDSLVKDGTKEFDDREIGFYFITEQYDKAKEVLQYLIENKNKWNKKWWGEKEKEYLALHTAVTGKDLQFIENYKNAKRKKTYSAFKLRCI